MIIRRMQSDLFLYVTLGLFAPKKSGVLIHQQRLFYMWLLGKQLNT